MVMNPAQPRSTVSKESPEGPIPDACEGRFEYDLTPPDAFPERRYRPIHKSVFVYRSNVQKRQEASSVRRSVTRDAPVRWVLSRSACDLRVVGGPVLYTVVRP